MAIKPPPLDVQLGMEVYASSTLGIGGRIRSTLEDFVVEEVLIDGSKAPVDLRGDEGQVSGWGRHLICVLIKRGWDTIAVVERIAEQIGISPEMINIAGIKDAQALTAQHISIGAISPERVRINLRGVRLIPMKYSREKISTEILLGNQFSIVVRLIPHSPAETSRMIGETWREISSLGGVPNFFGHQRFGTVRPITHIVGRLIIKGDFEGAVMAFLSKPGDREAPRSRIAREHLRETGDFRSALKRFPKGLLYERLLLRYLSRYPRDYIGALRRLPLRLRRLFIQAYQSYLFNRFLSERMKRGIPLTRIQIGDYLMSIGEEGLPTGRFLEVEENNPHWASSMLREGKAALALPLVGFDQKLSGGLQGEIEREILEKEGIQPRDFKVEKMLEASVRGGLRRALAPVMNFKFVTMPGDEGSVAKFSFMLHRGTYATVVMREFLKPSDPAEQGF